MNIIDMHFDTYLIPEALQSRQQRHQQHFDYQNTGPQHETAKDGIGKV